MAQGIQIWDSTGRLIIDSSTYVLKESTITIGQVTQDGSVDLSALINAGATITPVVAPNGTAAPNVTLGSDNRLRWSANGADAPFDAIISVMVD